MKTMSGRIDEAVGGIKAVLSDIFRLGDVEALELLHHGLLPIYADMAIMRGAWVQEEEEPLELDIEFPAIEEGSFEIVCDDGPDDPQGIDHLLKSIEEGGLER